MLLSHFRSKCPKCHRKKLQLTRREFLAAASTIVAGSVLGEPESRAQTGPLHLPSWTHPDAISDVFVATELPTPQYSLAGGSIPAGVSREAALSDAGIDTLINRMEREGTPFYQTASTPSGLIPSNGVIVIKINNQWVGQGSSSGLGRLSTNTDLLKGLIWRILNHPDGFSGEVVVAENTQFVIDDVYAVTPANAHDQDQSMADVITVFSNLGYPVSSMDWTTLNDNLLVCGTLNAEPASAEYVHGNTEDGYILLSDGEFSYPAIYSYPKFRTPGGRYISMRHGLWNGSTYTSDSVVLINMPVLKKHCMAGTTAAWKNFIGFVSCANETDRFSDWDTMHGYFWGYQSLGPTSYGLIGRQFSHIRQPDLTILDAVWVATIDNYSSYEAIQTNIVCASTDPFALDWYASEYIVRPIVPWDANDSSMARAGIFRQASLCNQKSTKSSWNGAYPWIDLDATHGSETPLDGEKNQMNIYLASASAQNFPIAIPILILEDEV
ncbi:DUF362 domain-containing protein [Desulfovibrio inopinatus]|uniref:DUF362 domain-containing protein n=1 Tax=Desulfovibrio inopinatus TaxID=102109 RepID=UPI00040F2266|nr:DUF362 domain-containing protein [Desulfovibrio inopinatus]